MYLYRYRKNEEIVYVGIAKNLKKRHREHVRNELWLQYGTGWTLEYLDISTLSRPDAEALEACLIKRYKTHQKANIKVVKREPTDQALQLLENDWQLYKTINPKDFPLFTPCSFLQYSIDTLYRIAEELLKQEGIKVEELDEFYIESLKTSSSPPRNHYNKIYLLQELVYTISLMQEAEMNISSNYMSLAKAMTLASTKLSFHNYMFKRSRKENNSII